MRRTTWCGCVAAAALAGVSEAGDLSIRRGAVDGGAATLSAGSFVLRGSIGQWEATPGPVSGGALSLRGGFWVGGGAAEPCVADLAAPFGLLDLADITAFVAGFASEDGIADLDGNGLWDLGDVVAFVAAFQTGCP